MEPSMFESLTDAELLDADSFESELTPDEMNMVPEVDRIKIANVSDNWLELEKQFPDRVF